MDVTISIPAAPEPEYSTRYRRSHGEAPVDERPVLRVEVYDAHDGYGIVGEDMVPGRSITIRADKDYQARLLYLREGKSVDPIYLYTDPRNEGKVHLAWTLADGSERGGDLSGGKTIDLRDIWADGWIIEVTH